MSNKYEDLIKNARMNADCGENMSPAEVTTLLNVVETTFAALAAENAGLKGAFDKPQAYLSWHAIPPTWEDPLPCGEYLDVHDEAGHKNSDGTDCWPVYAKPEIETPATDAFLAEVRAQAKADGVQEYADSFRHSASKIRECNGETIHVRALLHHAKNADEFAAQLRKGVQS
ncbi:hypothetical protein [Enterobacter rongchengensis]|uniref:hypothetical protein n=1 Tax=Enterobacter rongchengensis TaxID=3030999 RepID=UPI002A370800|nr:hypothetical protein [Enterobacter sp. 170250]MDY0424926.1 hypothetical protein [Enterobacter sp. 170250]